MNYFAFIFVFAFSGIFCMQGGKSDEIEKLKQELALSKITNEEQESEIKTRLLKEFAAKQAEKAERQRIRLTQLEQEQRILLEACSRVSSSNAIIACPRETKAGNEFITVKDYVRLSPANEYRIRISFFDGISFSPIELSTAEIDPPSTFIMLDREAQLRQNITFDLSTVDGKEKVTLSVQQIIDGLDFAVPACSFHSVAVDSLQLARDSSVAVASRGCSAGSTVSGGYNVKVVVDAESIPINIKAILYRDEMPTGFPEIDVK